jgi:hypothetical protein
MQSYYSFYGSPLHLILEDEIATAYNRRAKQFYDAQKRHEETHGKKWDPSEPLLMEVDEEAQLAWDKVGSVINLLAEINGGGLQIAEDATTSDYLIKL